jgi:hypothetical protein
MVSPYLEIGASILLSLVFWGVIRTALWLIPGILWASYLPLAATSLLAFMFIASLFVSRLGQAFDFRNWDKSRWALVFFLTGVAGGILSLSFDVLSFGLFSLMSLLWIRLFRLFRFPVPEAYFFPRATRFVVIFIFCSITLYRWLSALEKI